MATFTYRCQEPDHETGRFDAVHPVGAAPRTMSCPRCGRDAVRVFTPPMLSRAHAGARRLLEGAERSRSEPEVVTGLPASAGPRRSARPTNPAWSRLPRP